ncbi:GNAT family protein [uncultured Methylibium sp.]|uniref:GNAT family N-acetyltransferase n=1 Tax=uncultured Methylibium sp. TaxID=381093 RepID=UPI0025D0FD6C|nr:GNAT family protein [uncultured Methylibium sp.]
MTVAPIDPRLIEVPMRLDTPRLVIRCPRAGDGASYFEAVSASLDALKPWMPWAHEPQTPERSEALARGFHADFIARRDLVMAVFLRRADGGEGPLVGGTGLHRFDWALRRFEIGYWIRSGHGGQGLVTEAVNAVADMALTQLAARRVEIRCDDRNRPSWRVAERCGFVLEGVLRNEALDVQGLPRDTRVYARVDASRPASTAAGGPAAP